MPSGDSKIAGVTDSGGIRG